MLLGCLDEYRRQEHVSNNKLEAVIKKRSMPSIKCDQVYAVRDCGHLFYDFIPNRKQLMLLSYFKEVSFVIFHSIHHILCSDILTLLLFSSFFCTKLYSFYTPLFLYCSSDQEDTKPMGLNSLP